MTFTELYQEEQKKAGRKPKEWLQRVAVAAIVSTDTVYSWATGWRNPNRAAAELASHELGVPADELFPKKTKGARK